MNLATIHNAVTAAGIPLISVQSPDGVAIQLLFEDSATAAQRQQAAAIAVQASAVVTPDWEALKIALRGSSLFAQAFSTTNQNAWALLLGTLNSNSESGDVGRLADFQFAIAQVRAGLTTDYTTAQLASLNALLTAAHFPLQIK